MNPLKTTPKTTLKPPSKTTLVQSLEEIQEVNEMIAILKDYTNCVSSSMAVPYDMLKRGSENSIAMFSEKPMLIKIDVTKL